MANITTNPRYWVLDTAATIVAVGTTVVVRRIVLFPSAVNDDANINEYIAAGTASEAMHIKGGPSAVDPVTLDWGREGRALNGFILATLDGTSKLEVYIGRD